MTEPTKLIESCYNCGYDRSVVGKDENGWLCEWCADSENYGLIKHKKQILVNQKRSDWLGIIEDLVEHKITDDESLGRLFQKIKMLYKLGDK
jgi:hypothetical protein